MGTKEPVLIAGGISTLLAAIGALAIGYGWMNADQVALWIALVTAAAPIIGALWARSRVASEHTLKQTGQTLETVEAVANDPTMQLVPTTTGRP